MDPPTCTTGAGQYLLTGPSWTGGTPDGFDGVILASTDIVGCLGRTAFTDGDVADLRRIKHSYTAVPLSEHLGTPGAGRRAGGMAGLDRGRRNRHPFLRLPRSPLAVRAGSARGP
ncbi:DUF1254 domain-containing protein [Micromonospora sp. DT81.3]|uniref:DUF1254 domain-containing protein n=1 Tax=Micromonospora sp. DT81.3 TaxID=3416523 RepID=UPI003CEEA89B